MLSILLAIVIAVFNVFGHAVAVNAEGGEVFRDENVRLVWEIINSWDGGYQAQLTLENLSGSALNSWKIQMASSDQVVDFWGADLHISEKAAEDVKANGPVNAPADKTENVSADKSENIWADISENVSDNASEDFSENITEYISGNEIEVISENISADILADASENSLPNAYEITAFSYNNQIRPGESVTMGYIANGNGRRHTGGV